MTNLLSDVCYTSIKYSPKKEYSSHYNTVFKATNTTVRTAGPTIVNTVSSSQISADSKCLLLNTVIAASLSTR